MVNAWLEKKNDAVECFVNYFQVKVVEWVKLSMGQVGGEM